MNYTIEIKNLTKRFSGFTLEDVSLAVPGGSIMGLIGENGAGKSTTIKCLLGLLRPDSGSISVLGGDPSEAAVREWIGVVLDECPFHGGLTAQQVGKIMAREYKTWHPELYEDYLKKFDLPKNLFLKDFSKGMKMKLSIAAALAHHPRLLVLDEPSSGLARWDAFAAALPGGKRAVVKAKYQFLFLAFGGAFVLSCLVNLVISFAVREENGTFPELVAAALACTAVCLLIDCIFYPLLFRYGSQKSRIVLAAVFGAVFAVFAVAALLFSFSGGTPLDLLTGASPFAVAAGAVVLLAAAVVISYRVSCRIYDKKEF
ncbi:MAG: ATP-binding cassette domain-containing protein [Oscillospiraceae bacterium]